MNFIRFLIAHIQLAYRMYVISQIKMRGMIKEIQAHSQGLPHALSSQQLKRIRFYIGIILYEMTLICQLRGRKLSKTETQRAYYLGILIPLIDDINDELQLDTEAIRSRFESDKTDKEPSIQLAQFFYLKLIDIISDSDIFFKTLNDTTHAQDQSIRQMQKETLSEEELRIIARDKGGFAAKLYASMLEEPMKPGEAEAHYEIGYSFQLLNDMFDIWKDRQNGQQTTYTNSENWIREAHEFELNLKNVYSKFLALDYAEKDKRRFLINISILYGRGSVCMNQLLCLHERNGLPIHGQKFECKELICDMEKVKNIWNAFLFSMRHYHKYAAHKI